MPHRQNKYLAPSSLIRAHVDLDTVDPNSTEKSIRELAKSGTLTTYAYEPLAVVCGWPAGHFAAQMGDALMVWLPLKELGRRLTDTCVNEWDSRVPPWRSVVPKVNAALNDPNTNTLVFTGELAEGLESRWIAKGDVHPASASRWDVEDWYAFYILLAIKKLNNKDDFKALVDWVNRARIDEQVWIFYHAFLFLHFQKKYSLYNEQPFYKRMGKAITGSKTRELDH